MACNGARSTAVSSVSFPTLPRASVRPQPTANVYESAAETRLTRVRHGSTRCIPGTPGCNNEFYCHARVGAGSCSCVRTSILKNNKNYTRELQVARYFINELARRTTWHSRLVIELHSVWSRLYANHALIGLKTLYQ